MRKLTYGEYDETVRLNIARLRDVVAPGLARGGCVASLVALGNWWCVVLPAQGDHAIRE